MQNGPENLIFTDGWNIDKFLGIYIKHLDNTKFEITQLFLIEQSVTLLGLKDN